MSNWDNNPHYHPENVGLESLGSIDDAGSYEFHILAAWKDKKTGEVFYASDSGCSCPTPFEDHDTRASLTKITDQRAFDAFEQEAEGWTVSSTEREAFVAAVRKAWKNYKRRGA